MAASAPSSLATNASDETVITTFYNELSFLVQLIPKHNVLIIDKGMNDQIGKDKITHFTNTTHQTEMVNI